MRMVRWLPALLLGWALLVPPARAGIGEVYEKTKEERRTEAEEEAKANNDAAEKEARKKPLQRLYDHFRRKESSGAQGEEKSPTTIHEHYYYDYYGRPTYTQTQPYQVPPPAQGDGDSLAKVAEDLLLAYRAQEADLLALYLPSSREIFVEFPGADPVYLDREAFYVRTRGLFEEIRTMEAHEILRRERAQVALIKIRHRYHRAGTLREEEISFFLQRKGDVWELHQVRFGFPTHRRYGRTVPRSLTYADLEQGRVGLAYFYRKERERLIQHEADVTLGIWDYGGFFLKHWRLEEPWSDSPAAGHLRATLTDVGFKGQFVKAGKSKFSLSMELQGKWLTFSPPESVRADNPRLTALGAGLGFTASVPVARHGLLFGRLQGATFDAGTSAFEYEVGASVPLRDDLSLIVSHRGLDVGGEVLSTTRGGFEVKF